MASKRADALRRLSPLPKQDPVDVPPELPAEDPGAGPSGRGDLFRRIALGSFLGVATVQMAPQAEAMTSALRDRSYSLCLELRNLLKLEAGTDVVKLQVDPRLLIVLILAVIAPRCLSKDESEVDRIVRETGEELKRRMPPEIVGQLIPKIRQLALAGRRQLTFDLFLSHANADEPLPSELLALLGPNTFYAEHTIEGSEEWWEVILYAVRTCRLMVLMWSGKAARSKYVADEIEAALGTGRRIYPVAIDDTPRYPKLERFEHVTLNANLPAIAARIGALLTNLP